MSLPEELHHFLIRISNAHVEAVINPFGAELISFVSKKTGIEYIWQAGKEWPKHSPVLFPIVGSLKGGYYSYNGKEYHLERHGFARTKEFKVVTAENDKASFILDNDEETYKLFPFYFELQIDYVLKDDRLQVIYIVRNTGDEKMYFSIGAHPAFKIPLSVDEHYEDYFLDFNEIENAGLWPMNDGLLAIESTPFLNGNNIGLKKELFLKDALVFKGLQSDEIAIRSKQHDHGITMQFKGFPYFGVWAAKNADFVCLEPWNGITDSVNASGIIEEKEGILLLESGESFDCSWTIILR